VSHDFVMRFLPSPAVISGGRHTNVISSDAKAAVKKYIRSKPMSNVPFIACELHSAVPDKHFKVSN
jgi:hypothetical protein